jgi:hypothetical protein
MERVFEMTASKQKLNTTQNKSFVSNLTEYTLAQNCIHGNITLKKDLAKIKWGMDWSGLTTGLNCGPLHCRS